MSKLLSIALSQYGVKEIQGKEHNPTIVGYSKEIGYGGIITDETAWCSIFMNWCALKAGLTRSGKLNARSWLTVGEEVTTPQAGDVVVFWREQPGSWKGHVAIYINHSEDNKYIYCLGGNQNNQVCIKAYNASQLLGYRRLKEDGS
ncbi:MAG TPA: TIGR02594 family protein [Vicingaceae bacterium]